MKKLIFPFLALLLISDAANAQQKNRHASKPLCEDCTRFPYKPSGCDYSNCLVQLLSTATREDLLNYLALPANICDKVIFVRNRGVNNLQDYQAALEGYEYQSLWDAYYHYVSLRNPAKGNS